MIEFVTLLLGLVAGVQTVEVTVDDRVARVEMLLDGATIATIEGSPWLVQCDFGPLAPHELVAVAWDSSGREGSSRALLHPREIPGDARSPHRDLPPVQTRPSQQPMAARAANPIAEE